MAETHLLLAFAAAVTLLMLIPGPNVALIAGNSITRGARYGLLTVAGTSSAMIVQLLLVAAGMTGLLGSMGHWFAWMRWIGAAYLLYLGIMQWRAGPAELATIKADRGTPRRIYLRALLVSLSNPKTLLFLGAFLPQFIRGTRNIQSQLAMLSVIFLVIAIIVDSGWALMAARARDILSRRSQLRQRLTGGLLICTAAAIIRDK
jgi:homoserine/homoserine lactone efflux protein